MRVSLNWLREYVDISLPLDELLNRLAMAGFEGKVLQVIGGGWDNILIGEITAINPHPNADRLHLLTINLGSREETVVCGAPNCTVGAKVAFASVGAELTDPRTGEKVRLKPAKIRGVLSRGMACSEKELGISENHEGILILPDEAPIGTPLADYLGDVVLNLEITPNRPDCLSVIGLAREIAALTGQTVRLPEVSYPEEAPPVDDYASVEIAVPELCPRYCASVITGVRIGESPGWMQRRLLACGLRPINNVVDVTNYVMLEYGQPLHAFDYQMIRGRKVVVRRASPGERVVSLDGVERVLSADMLVIADAERAVAIAGVMGGANSEVTTETTSILLEAANFNPASIHRTGRALRLASEAAMRFERGISPELTLPALKRATQLIIELAGGRAATGLADVYPAKREPRPIALSTGEVKRVLGVEFSVERIRHVLTSLGFDCRPGGSAEEVLAIAPYWRSDITLPVDLIEEVARITGYDEIPTTMLSQPIPRHNPAPIIRLKQGLAQRLVGYGFQEIVSYSLTSLDLLSRLRPQRRPPEVMPLRVANPMTVEQEYLRPCLRAGLLAALAANRARVEGGLRLFELGRVYLPRPNKLSLIHI